MPDFTFNCPHCQQSLEASDELLGQECNCPLCNRPIRLPEPEPKQSVKPQNKTRTCPFCRETILLDAVKCKHCHEFLNDKNEQLATSPPQETPPVKATYNTSKGTFTGTMPLLVKLAVRAVQNLGWKLNTANEDMGIVTFTTGMTMGSWSGVSGSLNIKEISKNQFHVTGTGKQNLSGMQLVAFDLGDEAQKKAQKAIDKMKELAR